MRHWGSKAWRYVAVAVVAVVLQGCVTDDASQIDYTYTAPPTAAGKQCATQCQTVQRYCREACEARVDACELRSRRQARQEYERYVAQQKARKAKVERTPESFESYGSCSDSQCLDDCGNDFRVCYVNCGGKVRPVCGGGACGGTSAPPPQRPVRPTPAPSPVPPPKVDPNAPVSKTDGLCRPGAKVEVRSEGEWYAARVKGPLNAKGLCPVRYIGYGKQHDEAVPPRRMRAP